MFFLFRLIQKTTTWLSTRFWLYLYIPVVLRLSMKYSNSWHMTYYSSH